MVCEISPGRLRHCSNMSRTSAVHRSAAEGHPRPPSFLSRSIGDPSDPFGRDHTCLYAVIQDRVMLSSSVVDQSTIKALYRKTEQIPVTIIVRQCHKCNNSSKCNNGYNSVVMEIMYIMFLIVIICNNSSSMS